jgi:hypothetical protein
MGYKHGLDWGRHLDQLLLRDKAYQPSTELEGHGHRLQTANLERNGRLSAAEFGADPLIVEFLTIS